MGIGKDIASKMPPPDELDDVMNGPEPGEGTPGEEDEDKAARASAMEEFTSSLKGGSVDDQISAFEALMEACMPSKGY